MEQSLINYCVFPLNVHNTKLDILAEQIILAFEKQWFILDDSFIETVIPEIILTIHEEFNAGAERGWLYIDFDTLNINIKMREVN